MLPQIKEKKFSRCCEIDSEAFWGTCNQFLKGSLHSQTKFYLGGEGKGREGAGTEFPPTLCALYSFNNALYIELLRDIMLSL